MLTRSRAFGPFVFSLAACAAAPEGAPHEAPRPPPTLAPSTPSPMPTSAATPPRQDNPLLAPWTGLHGGVPPFAAVQVAQFTPALEAAMDEMRREVKLIAENRDAPTFDNTLVAFEDAGRTLDQVKTIFSIWSTSMADASFQAIERAMAPKLAAFSDEITQNEKLFARIEAVYQSPEKAKLTPEQARLVWKRYTSFVRAGAKLDAAAKKRVAAINERLAALYTDFSQRVLADEEGWVTWLEGDADAAGLAPPVRAGAAAAAEARGQKGKLAITNTRSAVEPFLTTSTRGDLREKVWKNFVSRGDHGDAHDTKKLITEMLKLRAERAKLLGYKTHAHWRLENTMAATPERAMKLMEEVWPAAVARVHEEVRDMQALADKDGLKRKIAPWDYRFYAEKVRKAKYALDGGEVKAYLQLDKLRDGMFWVAGELFGLTFTPVTGVPVYHPDVAVWEVKDRAGKAVGLWYFDPYARPGKKSGAWMNAYRTQERMKREITTLVSNNANFVKGKPGEPVLVSWDDAQTLFHEFGHALHGLLSNVTYPSLAGTRVARDYVEFPSQLLEHWLATPEVLGKFAVHHQTGKPMPPELAAKIKKSATFNQGFATVEYLSAALVDMKLHLEGDRDIEPGAFEKTTLAQLKMPAEIVMRHRTPQFNHLFVNDAYSAGYYSYLWSDALTADAFEAFTEGKGPFDKVVADKLVKNVLSVGDTVDPADGYRGFRGRDVDTKALMRKRGFAKAVPPAPAKK